MTLETEGPSSLRDTKGDSHTVESSKMETIKLVEKLTNDIILQN